jgi:hypothetical protein
VVNWLKHANELDMVTITGYEAAIVLIRAISKFIGVYRQVSQETPSSKPAANGDFRNQISPFP